MNKQLEEDIKRLKYIDRYYDCNNHYSRYDFDCIETVLKELEALQETIESKDRLLAITTIELNTAEEELERLQEENKNLKKANREKAEENKEIKELVFKENVYAGEKINKHTVKINELVRAVNKLTKEEGKNETI